MAMVIIMAMFINTAMLTPPAGFGKLGSEPS